MNLKTALLFLVAVLILGGVAALAFMDVPVEQTEISKDIKYGGATP